MDKTKNQKVDRLSQPPGSSPQISVAERLAEELNYQFGNKKEERVQYRCSIEKNSALIFTNVIIEKRYDNGPWQHDSTVAEGLTKQEAMLRQQEERQKLPPRD